MRMQTFGGTQTKNKKDNFDKFISEKRGFIRTSNGYANNNPMKITAEEIKQAIKGPGPAFATSYDNKYQQRTGYADSVGRFNENLDINGKQRPEMLAKSEKTKPRYDLKNSNFKFRGDNTEPNSATQVYKVGADHMSGKYIGRAKTNVKTRNSG